MMEKSCGWWLIWYLLFFCHGGAEGQLQWVVKEKVTAYGQNLTLFCPIEKCCSEAAGWSVGPKAIILDVNTFVNYPKLKYHGTYNKEGFGVVIRNLSEADLNVTYRCVYGFDQSTPKYLLHGDVFRGSTEEEMEDLYNTDNQTENEQDLPDKDKDINIAAIVVPIVVIMVAIGFIIGIVYCVYRSRIKNKRQREIGTDEEMEVIYHGDIKMENQQEGHVELIKIWRIEDKLFYDQTGGFTAVFDMVTSKNYMTIIGGPGSGKTATARHIALQLEKQGWNIVPVCRLEEIIQCGDRDHKQVFVLNDVLGIFAVDMNIYNYIINHTEQIFQSILGTSKLLFTCRKSVYTEGFKLGLFVTDNVVDLQSKDNQLTETEKMAICQYHCKSKGVNPDLYTSLSFTKANHMFPLLCKLFSMEEEYQRLGESFFNKSFDYFIKELDKLQGIYTIKYAVLVLCLVNGNKLSVECLPPEYMQNDVFNNCGINLGTSVNQIKDAINDMSETYFTKLNNKYTFTHDFIFEAIAYHYGRQNKHQILKYLSSSYIANKVTIYEQASNEDLCIQISEDMYLPLAKRLYKDIQSMNLFDVFMNKSLKHSSFLDVFERMLKTKPFDEFESLILKKCQNIQHFVNTIISAKQPIQQSIDIIAFDHLHMLFGTIRRTGFGSEHTCNVRVISWIINYGHTHLLQEIVSHVKRNNHSISLIFGSDVKENARLLLLGCYSKTLDMVELILKYVDPKCIDIKLTFGNFNTGNITPLIAGCKIGNECIVKALLSNRPDINKCNNQKESLLNTTSIHGPIDVVKCLHSSGADPNLCNEDGRSSLLIASKNGHCDAVKCLHRHGENINKCDVRGNSPLFLASMYGLFDVVEYLLSVGAATNLCNKDRKSPLFIASKHGNCDVVKCLLKYHADVNICDVRGQSPLFVASQFGRCDIAKYLLNSKAATNLSNTDEESPLFIASKNGHCDVVKYLHTFDAQINMCNVSGESPLFIASKNGHCDVVKCLLTIDAEINMCNVMEESPLFIASKNGHCDVVKYLHTFDAQINMCNLSGESPLFIASKNGHCDVVKCLLSLRANINMCDVRGQSPLFIASECGHWDVVICLLREHADTNLCNKDGQSPLFVASLYNEFEIVKCLLYDHAEINICDVRGQSPLFVASQFGRCDIAKWLLNYKAATNLCNKDGESPLFIASKNGQCDVVKCLLTFDAKINMRNVSGESPLFIASKNGHCDVVKYLHTFDAKINMCNVSGESPLFIASKNGHCDVVKCLLSLRANINMCDVRGQSPLFIASECGHCDVVICLHRDHADTNSRNKDGQSPLFVASKNGHCDVVKCLLSRRAKINMCDARGQSPLFIASMSGHDDIVKLLLQYSADATLCNKDEQSPLSIALANGHCKVVTLLS